MKKSIAVTTTLAAALLVGCSSENDEPASHEEASTVPAGVARQYQVLADELSEKGRSVESGEWTINLITEAAEPWHTVRHGGHSAYREPAAGETNHIEIIPVETATGRIVPDVPITLTVLDADDKVVQELDLAFYWSTFFHYAANFSIPEAGSYTLRAEVDAPTFNRHGEADEAPALAEGVTVEFTDVALGAE